MSVDFPQPDGPMKAVISFWDMSNVTLSTAAAPPYCTPTSASEKIVAVGVRSAAGSGGRRPDADVHGLSVLVDVACRVGVADLLGPRAAGCHS